MNPALRRGIRILGTCLFFVYMAGLIYCLFFAGRYGRLDAKRMAQLGTLIAGA